MFTFCRAAISGDLIGQALLGALVPKKFQTYQLVSKLSAAISQSRYKSQIATITSKKKKINKNIP
ncbi:hypothetical protein AB205_0126960 [Aquarana catesbeiana]|uniref:Uncharacterized protein n=1 Tax=Aquarana catesbeiana TaxID=8400 RepID=A0A2G9SAJ9_AQUCT|nr:hypothetical protein AB205_0126960 [Aquarana catesbeiana]